MPREIYEFVIVHDGSILYLATIIPLYIFSCQMIYLISGMKTQETMT